MPGTGLYESAVRPLLFRLDAERAHELALRASELTGRSALTRRAARRACAVRDPRLHTSLAGIPLANPLGLAAGFDKNGRAVAMLGAMGFGHVEIGSVSAHPSDGNPRPRLFRIPQDRGIVVSYGVPNEGAAAVRDAARRPPARGRARRQPRQDERSGAARRRARRVRGLRRLVRPAAGPRRVRRAQPELPELGRRPRLLRRAAAHRRAARAPRGVHAARAGVPQAQADARRRRAARDRGDRRPPPVRRRLRDQPARRQAGRPRAHVAAGVARADAGRGRRPAGRGLRQRDPGDPVRDRRARQPLRADRGRRGLHRRGRLPQAAARRDGGPALHRPRLPRPRRRAADPARPRRAAGARRARRRGRRRRCRRADACTHQRYPRWTLPGFRHEALLYSGRDDFLDRTLPFVLDGVARREPVLVAVDAAKSAAMRERLGAEADAVTFVDMAELGRNPGRIIPAVGRRSPTRHDGRRDPRDRGADLGGPQRRGARRVPAPRGAAEPRLRARRRLPPPVPVRHRARCATRSCTRPAAAIPLVAAGAASRAEPRLPRHRRSARPVRRAAPAPPGRSRHARVRTRDALRRPAPRGRRLRPRRAPAAPARRPRPRRGRAGHEQRPPRRRARRPAALARR